MRYLLQEPPHYDPIQSYPLWMVLHGAFAHAEQGIELFGVQAREQQTFLQAPQATRSCGEGFCWSFAHDTACNRRNEEAYAALLTWINIEQRTIALSSS